jgi:nucleotide-binding universal stress UspA family protein
LKAVCTPHIPETARFPIKTILHPTDFSECSQAAFQVARSLAHESGARLIVLHVASISTLYGGMLDGSSEKAPSLETAERRLDEMRAYAAERGVESLMQSGGARRDAPGSSD